MMNELDFITQHFGERMEYSEEAFIDLFSKSDLNHTKKFFARKKEEINFGDFVPLPELLFSIAAWRILEINYSSLESKIKEYISKLEKKGGYCPIPDFLMEDWRDDIEPEVYSTYYCKNIMSILENQELEGEEFIKRCYTDGYFYNEKWSDTIPKYRLNSEMRYQTLLALILLPEDERKEYRSQIEDNSQAEVGFLDALYYEYRLRKLLGLEIPQDKIIKRLKSLKLENGFRNYLLEDKIDEHAGSKHRTERDVNNSQIFSTFYAIQICKNEFPSENVFNRGEVQQFILNSRNEQAFGRPVRIREFENVFGEKNTALENLMVLLIPSLVS